VLAMGVALLPGACNTGASWLTQRAQLRGMDPGNAISMAALYPALVTVLSVAVRMERPGARNGTLRRGEDGAPRRS
jgi:drug/metabolite transporter (DMT)-like permease